MKQALVNTYIEHSSISKYNILEHYQRSSPKCVTPNLREHDTSLFKVMATYETYYTSVHLLMYCSYLSYQK